MIRYLLQLIGEQSLKQHKAQVYHLLATMGLTRFTSANLNLDSSYNWYTLLSGGEKKKMLIISAILQKPDILILDEVFNGLDLTSIEIVQNVLKKYLPNTMILAVDHHAVANNFNFYHHELCFTNKKVTLRDLP